MAPTNVALTLEPRDAVAGGWEVHCPKERPMGGLSWTTGGMNERAFSRLSGGVGPGGGEVSASGARWCTFETVRLMYAASWCCPKSVEAPSYRWTEYSSCVTT